MSESIGSLLSGRAYDQPPEVEIIKRFVSHKFRAQVSVTVRDRDILIITGSGALAGALRQHLLELQELCDTKKRLVIRI